MPPLPVLLMSGRNWKCYFVRKHSDNNILVQGPIDIGSSNSILGIFKILAAIQRLARWSTEDYLPWFEANCLNGAVLTRFDRLVLGEANEADEEDQEVE